MNLHPTKFIALILFAFLLLVNLSCSKDSDIFNEVISDEIEKNVEDNSQSNEEYILLTKTFNPTNDAYVQSGTGYNLNIIRLEEQNRTSYLMFDLSSLPGEVVSANLSFVIDSDQGDGTINVFKSDDTNWSETNLNSNNSPSTDELLGTIGRTFSIGTKQDLSLDADNINPETFSLVLTHDSGNDLAFSSKENPNNNGPKLVVTYKAPPGYVDPNPQSGTNNDNDSSSDNTGSGGDSSGTDSSDGDSSGNDTSDENNGGDNGSGQDNRPEDGAFYVTTNGSPNNNGLSENSAWSIAHAFEMATAGDVVYIKSGNYGNVQLNVDNSGTANNPIKFIGYTNTPGDLQSLQGSTFNYGDALDSSKMPLIEGNNPNQEGEGTGIEIREPYIQIENIQITKYENGLVSSGNNNLLKNIIAVQLGDFNPAHTFPDATSDPSLNYSGYGVRISGNNTEISNSIVINAGAENYTISGNSIVHNYNRSYSDNTVNPTDYYYLLVNADNNTLNNLHTERVGNLYHKGHGIILKVSAKNNIIRNSHCINTAFELSFEGVQNNLIENCFVGNYDSNIGRGKIGSFLMANGANNNTIKNSTVNLSSESAVKFMDWVDGSNNPGDAANAGYENLFIDCTFSNTKYGIDFNSDWNHDSTMANDNVFDNCTFDNLDYLFRVDRRNENNVLRNSTISNTTDFMFEKNIGKYSLNVQFSNNNFNNNGFPNP